MSKIKIFAAQRASHDLIVRIAKQSKYTRDYSNMIFSGEDCYSAGRIRVLTEDEVIRGFSCFRRRIRDGITVLYFTGVDAAHRNRGLGRALLADLVEQADGPLELKVMKDNPAARLYERVGFYVLAEAYGGKAWVMRRGGEALSAE